MKKNSIFGAASLALAGLLALAFFSCADVSGGAVASGAALGGQASGSVSFSFSQDFFQKAREASREIVKSRGGLVSKNDGALGGDVVPEQEQEQQPQASKMRLDVYLDGDCEEKKSIDIALEGSAAPEEGKERTIPAQTVKFDNIAVGKKIYARIYVYTIYPYMDSKTEKEGEAEALTIFGKSSEITVAEGDNDLSVPAYYLYKNISFKATITFDRVPDLSGNSNSLLVIDPSSELAARLKDAKDNFEIYNILKTMDKEKGVMAETDLYDTENPETHERVKNYTLDGTTLVVEDEFYLPVSEEDPAEKGRDILLALMLGKSSTDPQSYKATYDTKFYGITGEPITPKKKQTNEVSFNASSLGIVNTSYALYKKSDGDFEYYLCDSSSATPSGTPAISSSGTDYDAHSFCFDGDGKIYALSISHTGDGMVSGVYIKSNNTQSITGGRYECKDATGAPMTLNSIACDIKKNELFMFQDIDHPETTTGHTYVLYGTGDFIQSGTNEQTSYLLSLEHTGEPIGVDFQAVYSGAFCAYNGAAYFVGQSLEGKVYLLMADLSKKQEASGSGYNYKVDLEIVAEIQLPEGAEVFNLEENFSDMLYQDGAVYLLFKEKEDHISYVDVDSTPYYKSRGALIKCDVASGTVKSIGWTKDAMDISEAGFFGFYKDSSNNYKNFYKVEGPYTNANKWLVPGNVSGAWRGGSGGEIKSKLPKIYSPTLGAASNAFYSPQKFIAIKPKQLVFADNGAAFYADEENGGLRCKNAKRVVTVDLETFAITGINDSSAFLDIATSSFYTSAFDNLNAFGAFLTGANLYGSEGSVFDPIMGYSTSVYLGIPLGDE